MLFPHSQRLQKAESLLIQFAQSQVPGVWSELDKTQLLKEMKERLHDPTRVDQGHQPFCGPASVLFALISLAPDYYVEIGRNLFQIGGFHTRSNRWVNPSLPLRQTGVNLGMPQADWMILSTWRESENLIFPVDPTAPDLIRNLSGMTKSWEIAGWTREILGYDQVNYYHTSLRGDLVAIEKAAEVVSQGGVAFALINAEGMLTSKPPAISYPSHWITFLGNLKIEPTETESQISFEIYTWGQKMSVSLKQSDFQKYLWAIVTGL